MAKTKGELVTAALSELGIADFEFDATTDEATFAIDRMDTMMAFWSSKNVKLSYNFDGDSTENSGLPASAYEAVITNLAVRLAPAYGKTVPQELWSAAKASRTALFGESAKPLERQMQMIPWGAGHKYIDRTFISPIDKYPWEIDEYDDYSSSVTAIHVGDVGTVITIDVAGTDLSGATDILIYYRKPSGETGSWTGTLDVDVITYTTVTGDIDEDGVWFLQATFTLASWTGSSRVVAIDVLPAISEDS
jgi:hypothetical protein